MGNARLYFGSGSVTPTTIVEKEIPIIPTATVPFVVTNGYAHKGTNEGLNLTGVTGVQYNMYTDAYEENSNIVGPAIVNVNPNLFTNCGNYAFYGTFWNCANLTDTGFNPVTNINGNYICSYMYGRCPKLPDTQLTNVVSIIGDGACQEMFRNCEGLISTGLDNLTNISGIRACYSMFASCTNLTYMNLSNLQNISGNFATSYMFSECSNLSVVDMSNLKSISGINAFQNIFLNAPITTCYLNNLTNIAGNYACFELFNNSSSLTEININSLTDISGTSACQNMFGGCTNLTGALNFSNLKSISGTNACFMMFAQTGLTSVDFSNLPNNFSSSSESCKHMFWHSNKINSVNFGNRTTFPFNSSYMFIGTNLTNTGFNHITSIPNRSTVQGTYESCYNLVNPELENITSIEGNMSWFFSSCNKLEEIKFTKLQSLGRYANLASMCRNCQKIKAIYFPKLQSIYSSNTGVFNLMLGNAGLSGCTVYFPKALESTISNWADVQAGFGGSNVTVLFADYVEVAMNIPSGYQVWINGKDVTNLSSDLFAVNTTYEVIAKKIDITNTPASITVFTFNVTSSTTQFTFDPNSFQYTTIDINWTNGVVLNSLTAIYNELKVDLNTSNNPSQLLVYPNDISLTIDGTANDYYLVDSPEIIPSEISTVNLVFEQFNPTYYSPNQLRGQLKNTFAETGLGFDFVIENIEDVDYLRIHSHGISTEGAGYIKFNAADLQGYSTLTVSGSAFASCEQDYDFGYILYGDHFSRPTTRDEIYNQTTFDGNTYIINQSGHNNTSTPFQITFNIDPQDPKDFYVIIGFCEDYLYNEDPDSIYVSALTVTLA